jgi:hypothetical protein
MVRLYANCVIGRQVTEAGTRNYITTYGHEVLRRNASFRPRVRAVE